MIFIQNLHIHTGSDIKDVDIFVKGIDVLFDIIPHFNTELESVDLGGGFKVPYKGRSRNRYRTAGAKVAKPCQPPNPRANTWYCLVRAGQVPGKRRRLPGNGRK